jgi:hypothetical protein
LTAIAPAVRFNAFAIRVTPVFFFASDFNSRTSDDVHARLTVVFFADVFLADFFLADFFLAMSAPQFGSRACITPAFGKATQLVDELIFAKIPARERQGWPFDAFFAADITPPVICLICSPALVN